MKLTFEQFCRGEYFVDKDAARIQKYEDQFESLKEKYRGVPYREAFGGLKT